MTDPIQKPDRSPRVPEPYGTVCPWVITHDTGLMHIAAAFKKKIISIWGATVPDFGMYPYLPGEGSIMVQALHLRYRPTSKLGNRNTKRERRTMEEIDEKEVIDAANRLLGLTPTSRPS